MRSKPVDANATSNFLLSRSISVRSELSPRTKYGRVVRFMQVRIGATQVPCVACGRQPKRQFSHDTTMSLPLFHRVRPVRSRRRHRRRRRCRRLGRPRRLMPPTRWIIKWDSPLNVRSRLRYGSIAQH